jgi:S-layer protein (TIGR01567 family)
MHQEIEGRKMISHNFFRGHGPRIAVGIIVLALMLAGGAGATITVWDEGSPLPFSWNYKNFDGFNIGGFGTENLTILQTNLGASQRTIDKNNLIYSSQAQTKMLKVVSEQFNSSAVAAAAAGLNETFPGQAFYGGNYFAMGWQGQKYVALNGTVDRLTRIIIEQEASENKTLGVGESWDVGDGWTLKVNSIDVNAIPRQVNLTLSKDGIKKEDRIVTSGTVDAKPIYTYVEPAIAGETDAPLFVTYVNSVFLDGATAKVKFKYTWAVSTTVTRIWSSDTYGVFKDASIDNSNHILSLKNTDVAINLTRNSTQNLMGNLAFRVEDTSNLRFYPTIIAPTATNVTITSPVPNSYFTIGDPITFSASVEGGTVPYIYVWTSNIDGQIGKGETINANDLSVGEHRITLSVKDSTGKMGTSLVNIMISTGTNTPVVNAVKPEAWGYFLEGVDASLNITADVSDPDGISDIDKVVFTVGGKDYVASNGANGWSTQINAGSLSNSEILSVTAYDKEGHKSDAKTLQVKTVKIPWLLNPFIEVQSDNGKILYSFSGDFDSSNVLGDGWSSTTPNNIPIFGGYEHTISPPLVTVAGVWSTDGYGEISALLDMDMEFSGVKSKWKPSEAGVVKDLVKDMMTQFASGKYSYCSTYPGLCMRRSRYMLNGEIEVGGSGEVMIKKETLTLDQLRAFLNLSFEAEVPTPYSLNIPVAGNQGVVIVIEPHGSIEGVYEFSNNTMSLSNRTIQIGVSGGGKFKLGDEGGELVPLYVEIYVIGDLNVIIIYTAPAKNDVNLCLSGEAGAKARAGWSWFGNTWEGKIGPYTYPDGCNSGLKSSVSSLSSLKQAGWKWDMMRPAAKSPLSAESAVSSLAISKPDNAIIYDDYPDDFPTVAANNNSSALAVWVHGTDISVMPPKMSIYYSFWNGTNWSDPAPIHSDNTSVLNPQAVYYGNGAVAVWTGDKGKLDINDTFDNWTSTLEIYYSFWNSTSWAVPDRITNDTEADGMPAISSDGKNVTVVWMHDSDSNMSTKNDLDIHYSIWNGTAWSQPAALTSDNLQDYEPKLAQRADGTAIAVWTHNTDGNSSTDRDKEIYYSLWNGTWSIPAPLTENQFKDSKPYPTFNGIVPIVAWVQSQEIPVNVSYFNQTSNQTEYMEINVSKDSALFSEFKNSIWTAPVNISDQDFSISDVSISSDEKGNLIAAWRGYNNGNGDITYTVRDSSDLIWSPERKLANDSMINWKLSMDTAANKSIFVWLKHNSTIIFDNNTGPNINSTYDDVYYSILDIKPDLSISAEDIETANNIKVGETISINLTIHNMGALDSGNFTIRVFDGAPSNGTQIGSDIIADSIVSGGTFNVSMQYKVTKISTSIYVVLDPLNEISEINRTNNIAYRDIKVLPDLAITPNDFSIFSDETGQYLNIRMQNIGGVNESNVSLKIYDDYPPNGTLIYSGLYDVPTTETNISLHLNLTDGSHLIYAIIDPENIIEEIDETNNDAGYLIKMLPDLMVSSPQITYDAQNGTAMINTTVRNIGFSNATNISVVLIDDTNSNISLENMTELYRWNISRLDMNGHLPISTVINATESTKILLIVNPDNTIPEIDEFNNIISGSVGLKAITSLPIQVMNPSTNPAIILNDNGRPRPPGTNITRLNVTVTGNVSSVTIDLSPIGGSAEAPMIKIPGTDIYTITTNATAGINLVNNLVVNATDTRGNFNNSVSIPLTVSLRGDFNGDGKIDLKDLLFLRRHLAGLEPSINPLVADIQPAEGDGKVDLKDLLFLRRHLAGQEPLI